VHGWSLVCRHGDRQMCSGTYFDCRIVWMLLVFFLAVVLSTGPKLTPLHPAENDPRPGSRLGFDRCPDPPKPNLICSVRRPLRIKQHEVRFLRRTS
jgi:hypothetical protein